MTYNEKKSSCNTIIKTNNKKLYSDIVKRDSTTTQKVRPHQKARRALPHSALKKRETTVYHSRGYTASCAALHRAVPRNESWEKFITIAKRVTCREKKPCMYIQHQKNWIFTRRAVGGAPFVKFCCAAAFGGAVALDIVKKISQYSLKESQILITKNIYKTLLNTHDKNIHPNIH